MSNQAAELRICPKLGGSNFFFSGPEAELTNRVHVRHYDTRVPLSIPWKKHEFEKLKIVIESNISNLNDAT